jgi:hypothetical protein
MAGFGPSRNPWSPAVAAAVWVVLSRIGLALWAGAMVVEPPEIGRFFSAAHVSQTPPRNYRSLFYSLSQRRHLSGGATLQTPWPPGDQPLHLVAARRHALLPVSGYVHNTIIGSSTMDLFRLSRCGCGRLKVASKYPPAEPGALIKEPLKAALPGR